MECQSVGKARIDLRLEKLAEICRRYRLRSLALFGSALRDDFGPQSDVDLLVEFAPGATPRLGFFTLEIELTEALGRRVDLNTAAFLSRSYRSAVLAEAQPIHVAA